MDSDYGNGVVWEAWYDGAEGRWRSLSRDRDGRPLYEHEITSGEGHVSAVVANHTERTWWAYTGPAERGGAPHPTPDEIRTHLAEGRLEEVGRSADEIHLRSRPQEKSTDAQVIVMVGELWVDAATYLPRRSSFSGGSTKGSTTYTWLPRSEANVASTRLVIPHGYRQLAEPPAR
jgi:hypothetical protein